MFGTYDGESRRNSDLIDISCCDYIIQTGEYGFGPKHFSIYYDPSCNSFKLVDLFQGAGTFMLLSYPIIIKANFVISFGLLHFTFDVLSQE